MTPPARDAGPPAPGAAGTGGLYPNLAMLCAISAFASSFVANKALVLRISPGELLLGQLLIGMLCLWAHQLLTRGLPRPGADGWRMALMGISAPGLVNVANILGMQQTSAVNAVIIWSLMPLLMQLLGRLILREPLRASLVLGCLVAFGGVLLILVSRYGREQGALSGDLLVLCAVVASIFTQLLGRRVNQRADSLTVATLQVTAACAVAVLAFPLLADTGALFAGWTPGVAAGLVYLGVVCTFLLFVLYNTALRHLPVGHVGLYMPLIPAIGTVGAATMLGEPVVATDLAGLAVVMAGVGLPFLIALAGRLR